MRFWLFLLLLSSFSFASLQADVQNDAFTVGTPTVFSYFVSCAGQDAYLKNGDLVFYKFKFAFLNESFTPISSKFVFKDGCAKNGTFTAFVPQSALDSRGKLNASVVFQAQRYDEAVNFYPIQKSFSFSYRTPPTEIDLTPPLEDIQPPTFNWFSLWVIGGFLVAIGIFVLILQNPLGFVAILLGIILIALDVFLHIRF